MAAKHILVVEDDEPIAELIRHSLTREGFRVTCFTSGEKLLQREKIELQEWRGSDAGRVEQRAGEQDADTLLIKTEKMPDGRTKRILKDRRSGEIIQKIE